jgi:SNF family Na+-dependent transporter
MSFASKLKTAGIQTLAPTFFYGTVGIIFLVLLPFADFPPHIALTGILSIVTAYGLLKKRFWALWLVVAVFAVATTFSLYTLSIVGFTNWVVSTSMIVYAVLTWLVTLYIVLKRKPSEA